MRKEFDPLRFVGSEMFSPSMDMSFHMDYSESGELIREKEYDVLANLEPQIEYGHITVGDFTDDFINHTQNTGTGVLQIIGESLSGKSFAASQWASLFADKKITSCYIPWVDVIRDAKGTGLIAQDTQFGALSSDEFEAVSTLYLQTTKDVIAKHSSDQITEPLAVIGEVVGLPAMDEELIPLNRGTTAVRQLVRDDSAYVAAIYGSSEMRETGKAFRKEFFTLQDGAKVRETMAEFGINSKEKDLAKLQKMFQESGAPPAAVDAIENQINRILVHLADQGKIALPEEMRSITYLQKHPEVRTSLIGHQVLPFLLKEVIDVPEDRALLCLNNKIEDKPLTRYPVDTIHYREYLKD